jgi:hypothetical protein
MIKIRKDTAEFALKRLMAERANLLAAKRALQFKWTDARQQWLDDLNSSILDITAALEGK